MNKSFSLSMGVAMSGGVAPLNLWASELLACGRSRQIQIKLTKLKTNTQLGVCKAFSTGSNNHNGNSNNEKTAQ